MSIYRILTVLTLIASASAVTVRPSAVDICDLVQGNGTYYLKDIINSTSPNCEGYIDIITDRNTIWWLIEKDDIFKTDGQAGNHFQISYALLTTLYWLRSKFRISFKADSNLRMEVKSGFDPNLNKHALCRLIVDTEVYSDCIYPKSLKETAMISQEQDSIFVEYKGGTSRRWRKSFIIYVNNDVFTIHGDTHRVFILIETCPLTTMFPTSTWSVTPETSYTADTTEIEITTRVPISTTTVSTTTHPTYVSTSTPSIATNRTTLTTTTALTTTSDQDVSTIIDCPEEHGSPKNHTINIETLCYSVRKPGVYDLKATLNLPPEMIFNSKTFITKQPHNVEWLLEGNNLFKAVSGSAISAIDDNSLQDLINTGKYLNLKMRAQSTLRLLITPQITMQKFCGIHVHPSQVEISCHDLTITHTNIEELRISQQEDHVQVDQIYESTIVRTGLKNTFINELQFTGGNIVDLSDVKQHLLRIVLQNCSNMCLDTDYWNNLNLPHFVYDIDKVVYMDYMCLCEIVRVAGIYNVINYKKDQSKVLRNVILVPGNEAIYIRFLGKFRNPSNAGGRVIYKLFTDDEWSYLRLITQSDSEYEISVNDNVRLDFNSSNKDSNEIKIKNVKTFADQVIRASDYDKMTLLQTTTGVRLTYVPNGGGAEAYIDYEDYIVYEVSLNADYDKSYHPFVAAYVTISKILRKCPKLFNI